MTSQQNDDTLSRNEDNLSVISDYSGDSTQADEKIILGLSCSNSTSDTTASEESENSSAKLELDLADVIDSCSLLDGEVINLWETQSGSVDNLFPADERNSEEIGESDFFSESEDEEGFPLTTSFCRLLSPTDTINHASFTTGKRNSRSSLDCEKFRHNALDDSDAEALLGLYRQLCESSSQKTSKTTRLSSRTSPDGGAVQGFDQSDDSRSKLENKNAIENKSVEKASENNKNQTSTTILENNSKKKLPARTMSFVEYFDKGKKNFKQRFSLRKTSRFSLHKSTGSLNKKKVKNSENTDLNHYPQKQIEQSPIELFVAETDEEKNKSRRNTSFLDKDYDEDISQESEDSRSNFIDRNNQVTENQNSPLSQNFEISQKEPEVDDNENVENEHSFTEVSETNCDHCNVIETDPQLESIEIASNNCSKEEINPKPEMNTDQNLEVDKSIQKSQLCASTSHTSLANIIWDDVANGKKDSARDTGFESAASADCISNFSNTTSKPQNPTLLGKSREQPLDILGPNNDGDLKENFASNKDISLKKISSSSDATDSSGNEEATRENVNPAIKVKAEEKEKNTSGPTYKAFKIDDYDNELLNKLLTTSNNSLQYKRQGMGLKKKKNNGNLAESQSAKRPSVQPSKQQSSLKAKPMTSSQAQLFPEKVIKPESKNKKKEKVCNLERRGRPSFRSSSTSEQPSVSSENLYHMSQIPSNNFRKNESTTGQEFGSNPSFMYHRPPMHCTQPSAYSVDQFPRPPTISSNTHFASYRQNFQNPLSGPPLNHSKDNHQFYQDPLPPSIVRSRFQSFHPFDASMQQRHDRQSNRPQFDYYQDDDLVTEQYQHSYDTDRHQPWLEAEEMRGWLDDMNDSCRDLMADYDDFNEQDYFYAGDDDYEQQWVEEASNTFSRGVKVGQMPHHVVDENYHHSGDLYNEFMESFARDLRDPRMCLREQNFRCQVMSEMQRLRSVVSWPELMSFYDAIMQQYHRISMLPVAGEEKEYEVRRMLQSMVEEVLSPNVGQVSENHQRLLLNF